MFSKSDSNLMSGIYTALDQRNFEKARIDTFQRLNTLDIDKPNELILKISLAGALIDTGSESNSEDLIKKGIEIILEDREKCKNLIFEGSFEYNLANGKKALFNIRRKANTHKIDLSILPLLVEAKNHYWKAFKLSDQINGPNVELLTNLANSLSSCGRVVESLQFFDSALKLVSDFPIALYNRANELYFLNSISDSYSITLLYQMCGAYKQILNMKDLPFSITEDAKIRFNFVEKILQLQGTTKDKIHRDIQENEQESKTHNEFRKFCIDHFLCLSEHSLYCNCLGARTDDLIIWNTKREYQPEYIPMMEKVLNRLKSEYSLARLLFYKSEKDSFESNIYDNEISYLELSNSELVGTQVEMLRTSFRMCFGILDKIAMSICKLFDLAEANENIYFESFWNPKGKNLSPKQKSRWERINKLENISLIALYTQATDLNKNEGEWGMYKKWRNLLEHNFMIIRGKNGEDFEDDLFINEIGLEDFKNKALHLLQFTRSAIFNFVFLVRIEGVKSKEKL